MTELLNKFTLYTRYSQDDQKNINQEEYTEMVKEVAEIKTLDEFVQIFSYLKKPHDSANGMEISLFKNGIKPVWESEEHKEGGKVNLKLKKENSNIVWDEVVLNFVTDSFPYVSNEDITGVLFSVKNNFTVVQVWFKTFNSQVANNFTSSMRSIFSLDESFEFDIRPFNKSLQFSFKKVNKWTIRTLPKF